MRTTATLIIVSTISLIFAIATGIIGSYQLDRDVLSYWNLADKSSTIEEKSRNIDLFVESLQGQGFEGKHNALFMTTPDNSFDMNFIALQSLQSRLHDIQQMDIRSFEYQTAIQQITQQEQGDALEMISVFTGIWWKTHHPLVWNWVGVVWITIMSFVLIGSWIWVLIES